MQPFDPKTYNKAVLAKYRDSGQPDEFGRYLLDLTDDDDEQIEERLDQVLPFWNNNKTLPPPIGPLITSLINEHSFTQPVIIDGETGLIPPGYPRGTPVDVSFDMNNSGVLTVTVRHPSMPEPQILKHKSGKGVTDEEIAEYQAQMAAITRSP